MAPPRFEPVSEWLPYLNTGPGVSRGCPTVSLGSHVYRGIRLGTLYASLFACEYAFYLMYVFCLCYYGPTIHIVHFSFTQGFTRRIYVQDKRHLFTSWPRVAHTATIRSLFTAKRDSPSQDIERGQYEACLPTGGIN